MSTTCKIMSLNVNGISNLGKIDFLKKYLMQNSPDVILLQEVISDDFNLYGYDKVRSLMNETNHMELITLVKQGISYTDVESSLDGRLLTLKINRNTRIINIYAPSGSQNKQQRESFFNETLAYHLRHSQDEIIIGGDFNCVLEKKDVKGEFNNSPVLQQIITELKLSDAWRMNNLNSQSYTFYRGVSASRLDRFYLSHNLKSHNKGCYIHPCPVSDHCAVVLEIQLVDTTIQYGRGYWKMNTKHLTDPEFKESLTKKWEYWKKKRKDYPSMLSWWENLVKPNLLKFCTYFAKEKNRILKETTEFYYQCLLQMQKTLDQNERVYQDYTSIKRKLYQLHEEEFLKKQAGIRIKVKIQNERTNLYHVTKNKKEQQCRFINKIKKQDGSEVSSSIQIIHEFENHYTALFGSDEVSIDEANLLIANLSNKLVDGDNDILNAEITEEELKKVIFSTAKNKSPGIDGIPYEFYQTFWYLIKDEFLEIIKEMFERGPEKSQQVGTIVLIPKTKAPSEVSNFRPITLLCADYKILAKIMANRLQLVIDKIVSDNQVLIAGKGNITDLLCLIRDLIIYSKSEKLDSHALINLDFKSAFDLVSHKYLFKILDLFGFKGIFSTCLRNIYLSAKTQVLINGFISKKIEIKRSVRQGCPLSMLLFALALEPLISNLQIRLAGISIGQHRLQVFNYADDVNIIVSTQDDVVTTRNVLFQYEKGSGAQLNTKKSNYLRLGVTKPDKLEIEYATENPDGKVLGMYIGPNLQKITMNNWDRIIANINAAFHQYRFRDISLIEKVWFINSYILSKVWYMSMVIPPRKKDIAHINKMIGFFLWTGNIFRIRRSVLYQNTEKGGVKLINPQLKADALFVKTMNRLIEGNSCSSNIIVQAWYNGDLPTKPAYLQKIENELPSFRLNPKKWYNEKLNETEEIPACLQNTPGKNWTLIWDNINKKFLSVQVKSYLYKLVHGVITNRVILNRIRQNEDESCMQCGQQDTTLHRFNSCKHKDIWMAMKNKLSDLLFFDLIDYEDEELLFLECQASPPLARHRVGLFIVANTIYYIGKTEKFGMIKSIDGWREHLKSARFKIHKVGNVFGHYVNKIL